MAKTDEDGPRVSRSTRRKAYKAGPKFYRPFGLDDPQGALEMLCDRYGQETIGLIFSKLSGCSIAFAAQRKQHPDNNSVTPQKKQQQNNNPVNPVMLRAFMSNMKKIKETDP